MVIAAGGTERTCKARTDCYATESECRWARHQIALDEAACEATPPDEAY